MSLPLRAARVAGRRPARASGTLRRANRPSARALSSKPRFDHPGFMNATDDVDRKWMGVLRAEELHGYDADPDEGVAPETVDRQEVNTARIVGIVLVSGLALFASWCSSTITAAPVPSEEARQKGGWTIEDKLDLVAEIERLEAAEKATYGRVL